jgi:outer membrane protein TolC
MKRIILILLLGMIAEKGWSQTTFTSVQQVLDFADKNNRFLQQDRLDEQVSTKDQDLLKSTLSPKVNFYSTADYYPIIPSQVIPDIFNGGNGEKFRKVQFGLPINFTTGVELTMPIINFEKWETLKKAALQIEGAKWKTETDKERLHNQLTELYYKILVAKEFLQLNKENERVTTELLQLMELRKKEGTVNPSDYNRAKNLSLDIQTASIEYERAYKSYLNAFKSLLFLQADDEVQVSDSLKVSINVPQAISVDQRPASKQAALMVKIAEQSIREAQKASLPKLSLNSRYYYQFGIKPGANSQTVQFDASTIGLRLDFPLFQGGYYKISQQKAKLQLQAARLNEEGVKETLSKEQRDWWIALTAAQKKASVLQQKVQVTADNLRIAQLSMKEGVMEYDEFSNIFMEDIKARIDLVQNLGEATIYQLLLTQNK